MIWKALLFLGIYAVLHFGYELTGWRFLIPFCGVDESVFEHLKIGFWAYFLTNVLEYVVSRKRRNGAWWFSRLFSGTLLPWFIVIVWYMVPVFFGHVESLVVELIWAFFVTFISGVFSIVVERNIEKRPLTASFVSVIILLFAVSIVFFTAFSFEKPWVDLFVEH
ncbi:MAG: hypothetical protein PWP37_1475 [Thermotogota bacterium]|nr:hypothetical protein [Thermotogota bacterium]